MKLIILLFLCLLHYSSFAQNIQTDSLKTAQKAITDADKYLKINKNIRKAFRHKSLSSTSDYFKPTLKTTSDPKFLEDSNYVKVYRHTAFENTVYQIPLNRTKVVIVAAVVAGVVAVVIIIVKLVDAFVDSITKSLI